MKFTASAAALVLLQGTAIALPRGTNVQSLVDNDLTFNLLQSRPPHSSPQNRPNPVVPGVTPGFEPGNNNPVLSPGTQPETNPDNNPVLPPGTQPETNLDNNPVLLPGTQPETNLDNNPVLLPGTQPGINLDNNPVLLPGTQPGTNPDNNPVFAPGTQPGTKPDNPVSSPGNQPGFGPDNNNPAKPSPSDTAGGQVPGPVVDDYPQAWKGDCGASDENGLIKCQCTSFAAFRAVTRLNVDFRRLGGQMGWGNANQWAVVAREAGLVVDKTAAPGAIAQTTAGDFGHVAWVASVDGNRIGIEDYNGAGGDEVYGTRIASADDFEYIHF